MIVNSIDRFEYCDFPLISNRAVFFVSIRAIAFDERKIIIGIIGCRFFVFIEKCNPYKESDIRVNGALFCWVNGVLCCGSC